MRIGPLDRRVQVQRLTRTRDLSGGEVETWQAVATTWAARVDPSGRSFFEASSSQEVAAERVTWRVRWMPGLDTTHRVVDALGGLWDVLAVTERGRREALELRCERMGA